MALKTMKVKGLRWNTGRGCKKWYKRQMNRWMRRNLQDKRRYIGYAD